MHRSFRAPYGRGIMSRRSASGVPAAGQFCQYIDSKLRQVTDEQKQAVEPFSFYNRSIPVQANAGDRPTRRGHDATLKNFSIASYVT
jgi:hypothetical protein